VNTVAYKALNGMKFYLIIFIFSSIIQYSEGQTKRLTIDSDTSYWHQYYSTHIHEMKLQEAKDVNADSLFRFWDEHKFFELIYANNSFQGSVVFFIRQYKRNKKGHLYFRKQILTYEGASRLHNLVNKYNITSMPSSGKIIGWTDVLDGEIYITEKSNRKSFSFKSYDTPTTQMDLIEARQLIGFINDVNQIEELKQGELSFMERQPFKAWYGGIGETTIVRKVINAR
jgi:hypothetical protein